MTRDEKKSIYSRLCDQGRITGLFMQPWWLDATGTWDVALGIRNGQVVGAMPFARQRTWGLKKIGMPAMTHHLRLWMDKPSDISDHKWLTREKQIIWLIIDDLPSYSFFSMVFEERSFNNWLPFHWKGFRQEMRYTFTIGRGQYENENYKLNRNLRRNVREAEHELILRHDVDLTSFYEVCKTTYKRQKMRMPFSPGQFKSIDSAIQTHQAGMRMGAYTSSNDLVAVSWLLWDKECAYYFIAGDNEQGRQQGASILLCYEAIRMAFEDRKVNTFDFCGSMLESVVDMRRQFGAQAQGLMKIWRAKHKWLDVALTLTR